MGHLPHFCCIAEDKWIISRTINKWTKFWEKNYIYIWPWLSFQSKRKRGMGIGHQGIHKGKEVTGSMQRKAEWISSIIQAVRQGEDKLNYALNYSGDRRDIHLEECEVFIKIWRFPFIWNALGLQSGSDVFLSRILIKNWWKSRYTLCFPSNVSWALAFKNSLVSQSMNPIQIGGYIFIRMGNTITFPENEVFGLLLSNWGTK